MTLIAGAKLGPYEIVAPLGAGGMGEVYKGRDTRLNRTVAIKVLPQQISNQPEFRQRFEREAQTIAALNHPHICTVHDVGHHDGIDYLVMEYLEGETLDQRFLMIQAVAPEPPANQINVVLNWFEELRQRVPTGKQEGSGTGFRLQAAGPSNASR